MDIWFGLGISDPSVSGVGKVWIKNQTNWPMHKSFSFKEFSQGSAKLNCINTREVSIPTRLTSQDQGLFSVLSLSVNAGKFEFIACSSSLSQWVIN